MADFAVDISKTAVEAVVNKVKTAIKEEDELLQIVQRDLVFIADEFEMMQSFLNSADEERIKNNVVRTWVRQVRDLSYDAEDCIESVLHLDTKRTFRTFWRRLLASFTPTGAELPLDKVVGEIKLLKARVEDVSQRNMRYNLIGDSGSKPVVQMQQMPADSTRKLDILTEARDTAKELTGFSDLAGLLTRDDSDCQLRVISVWGTGDDLGMKSIVKEAYDNPEIHKDIRYRAWVKLMHPFSPDKFMRSLVTQFYANSVHQQVVIDGDVLAWVEGAQGAGIVAVFMKLVSEQRYLIVLEDLSNLAEWHAVRTYLPDAKNRSRIVVSTRLLEVASSCTGHPYKVFELNHISDNHSVCVFFNEGFQRDEVIDGGGFSFRREPNHTENHFRLVGRDSERRILDDLILRVHEDMPNVVYVWGMAGAGKSALVKNVYRRWIFKNYAWIDVSHPFSLMDFSRSIVSSMLPGSQRVTDPVHECLKLLHKDRCLLVIDGLQYKKDWDLIYSKLIRQPSDWQLGSMRHSNGGKFPNRLSCIVLTTEENIFRHGVKAHDAVCHVPVLHDDAALDLFKQVLWREMIAHVDEDRIMHALEEEGSILVPNCGGLPSVIVALGRYLAHLHTLQRGMHERQWKRLNANTMRELESNPEFDSLRRLFNQLHSNFHACPQHLKKCIFYLSVFPRHSIIRRKRLVRRWLAEGYSKGTDGSSLEEGAQKLVDKLADMGFMRAPQATTVTGDTRMSSWQVNSLFLEYIISHQTEDKIFLPLEVSVLEQKCNLSSGHVGQHLAIRSCWERDEFVFNSLDLSRLRSLTVFGSWEPFFISDRMRVLRVLDLEGTSDIKDDDLKQIVEKLGRLKFLSLRGCRKVSRLPDNLGDLNQLQTLDVRDTPINELPQSTNKLKKLEYIRAGSDTTLQWADDEPSSRSRVRTMVFYMSNCGTNGPSSSHDGGGIKVPRGIGRLAALHTLCVVNVSSPHGDATLDEVHHLKQLKRLGVSGINRSNKQNMFLAFSGSLESLSVRGTALPRNIRFPRSLTKLRLEMTTLSASEDIQAIGTLEKLQILRLFVKSVPGEIQFCGKSESAESNVPKEFSDLRVLEIGCSSNLCVSFGKEALKNLEQLKIHHPSGSSSSSLEFMFNGIENLVSLKQVQVKGSCDETLKQNLEHQLTTRHPKNPVLKLEE